MHKGKVCVCVCVRAPMIERERERDKTAVNDIHSVICAVSALFAIHKLCELTVQRYQRLMHSS